MLNNYKIVVDLKKYNGTTQTAIKDGKCIYTGKPESYYIEQGFSIITPDELEPIHEKYLNDLCGDWEEITAEKYDEMLNILPPLRWKDGGFYMAERYTDDVAGFYQQINGRYYTSLQRLSYKRDDILSDLRRWISNREALTLTHKGEDSWGRQVYEDETGRLWKDTDNRRGWLDRLCSVCGNTFEGEPDCPMKKEIKCTFIPERIIRD